MPPPSARAVAPCTVGNFGPGFDVLSLALDRPGDAVTLAVAERDEVVVRGLGADAIPTDFGKNCASAAVHHLRETLGVHESYRVEVEKGVPPGSGLGSSASSSAAGALAFAKLHRGGDVSAPHPRNVFASRSAERRGRLDVPPDLLLEAAAAGERAAAGDHRDDVSAALFGGLALVSPRPGPVLRLEPPRHLRLAVARPHVTLETRRMRAVLPREVPRADVVHNLAMVARLVDALHRGDVPAMGRAMDDRLAVPHRAPLVPGYAAARDAALKEGAFGYCLSGSGPAQFAVCDSDEMGARVLRVMLDAYASADVGCDGFVAGASYKGVEDA